MSPPLLLIGVVSHPGSQRSHSVGPKGLGYQLAARIPSTEFFASAQNTFNDSYLVLNRAEARKSAIATTLLERQWQRYIDADYSVRRELGFALRLTRQNLKFARSDSVRRLRRLLNIELSHRLLMKRGLDSGARWILILEDDAEAHDIEDACRGIHGLISNSDTLGFINLSASFSLSELQIQHLVDDHARLPWSGTMPRDLLPVRLPITNTVCAVLYSRSFLQILFARLEAMPLSPVIPIDWKINLALIQMSEVPNIGPINCWIIQPEPIVQMSMHSAGIIEP